MKWYKTKLRMKKAYRFFVKDYGENTPGVEKVVVRLYERYFVNTVNGRIAVYDGDYVIQEPNDPTKYYPCEPDLFESGHEEV